MSQKITMPEKRQSDDEVILQALEDAKEMLKQQREFCLEQRNNFLNDVPMKFMGLDECDDIMLVGYDVDGAIDLVKKRIEDATKKTATKVRKAGQ